MLAAIPYSAPLGLRATAETGQPVRVRLPFTKAAANYVGTAHAGALFTLAEAAAGIAAYRLVADLSGLVLLRGATVRYTRRAESDMTATARITEEAEVSARTAFERERRGDVNVQVVVTAEGSEAVFDGTFDYALRARTR